MNILNLGMKIFISMFLLLSILGAVFYLSQGITERTHINFDENGKITTFELPDLNIYHAKVKIKGHLACDRQIQLLSNSKRYNQPIQLKEGYVNEVVFDNDWYDSILGVEFFPVNENCEENKIKVIVTFYGFE